MASVDPNIYALNIQLQLDSAAAFDALQEFGDTLEALEDKISKAANSILGDITSISVGLNKSLDKTVADIISIDSKNANMLKSMTEYNKFVDDSSKIMESDLKNLTTIEELWKNIALHHKDVDDSITRESKELTKFIKTIDTVDKAIKEKNESHAKENEYVEKEGKLLRDIVSQSRNHANSQKDVVSVIGDVAKAVGGVFQRYAELTRQADEFRTVNFRLYGSQMDLLTASQKLSGEFGIAQEEAVAIYKGLANSRAARGDIDKLAKSVAKIGLVTGISTGELVKYTKALRAAGYNEEAQAKNLEMLAKAMKSYGISSEDAAKALNYTASELITLQNQFGGSREEAEKFRASLLEMQGLAGIEGLSDGIIAYREALKDPTMLMQIEQITGMQIKSAEDFSRASMKMGKDFSDAQDMINAAREKGLDTKQLTNELNAQMQAYTGSVEAGNALAKVYKQLDKEAKALGKDINNLTKEEREQLLEKAGVYNTLSAQWDKFTTAIQAALNTTIVRFFAEGLKDLLWGVNQVIEAITKFVTWLQELGKYMYENSAIIRVLTDGFMVIYPYLRGFAALILVIVAAVGALGVSIGGLMTTFIGFSRAAQTIATVSQSLATAIISIARAIGQSIFIILSSLGRGLAALGQAVMPVLPALFALATMTLMVGASFYLVALALVEMNKVGWPAIAMFAVMAVIMILFIGALVALGYAAMAVLPALLVLSAVMISIGVMVALIGAGIMMIGMGVLFIGMGIEKMAAGLSLGLAGQVIALAASLAVLSAAAWYNMYGITSLANAFKTLGDSIKVGKESIQPMIDAIKAMDDLANTNPATKFAESLKNIDDSIKDVDMSKLRKIAADLNEGAREMMSSMIPLFFVSAALAVSGAMFVFGANALSAGIKLLDTSAGLLEPAAIKIHDGFIKLAEVMPIMLTTSLQLLAVSPIMLIGALVFTVASAALLAGSVIFAAASGFLYAGANMFKPGAEMIDIGADYLVRASIKIASNAAVIFFALYVLGSMGMGIYAIGAALILGGGMLIIGALLVFSSAITLNLAFMMLEGLAIRYEDTIDKIAKLGEGLKLLLTGVGSFYSMTLSGLGSLTGITAAFSTEIDAIISQLDEYATAFERAAVRISEAINNKVIPAMQAARQAGVMEAIRSETIVQTGTMKSEGGEASQGEAIATASEPQNTDEDGGKKVLTQILALLQEVLPDIADKGGRAFGTNMAGW